MENLSINEGEFSPTPSAHMVNLQPNTRDDRDSNHGRHTRPFNGSNWSNRNTANHSNP